MCWTDLVRGQSYSTGSTPIYWNIGAFLFIHILSIGADVGTFIFKSYYCFSSWCQVNIYQPLLQIFLTLLLLKF